MHDQTFDHPMNASLVVSHPRHVVSHSVDNLNSSRIGLNDLCALFAGLTLVQSTLLYRGTFADLLFSLFVSWLLLDIDMTDSIRLPKCAPNSLSHA